MRPHNHIHAKWLYLWIKFTLELSNTMGFACVCVQLAMYLQVEGVVQEEIFFGMQEKVLLTGSVTKRCLHRLPLSRSCSPTSPCSLPLRARVLLTATHKHHAKTKNLKKPTLEDTTQRQD
jgi:hypothetical protein